MMNLEMEEQRRKMKSQKEENLKRKVTDAEKKVRAQLMKAK